MSHSSKRGDYLFANSRTAKSSALSVIPARRQNPTEWTWRADVAAEPIGQRDASGDAQRGGEHDRTAILRYSDGTEDRHICPDQGTAGQMARNPIPKRRRDFHCEHLDGEDLLAKPSRRLLRRLELIEHLPRRKQAALLTTIGTFLKSTPSKAAS
jgi:hypothetical protein